MPARQVSDFGLTRFREELKSIDVEQVQGSVHWQAPEVLSGTQNADLMPADVYAFGIIMWELLTRDFPYSGMWFVSQRASLPPFPSRSHH
jgi:serine/threonine protein kinase